MANDFLLNGDNELIIKDGDFVVGDSEMQEVGLLIGLNQGALKSDPILGVNLITNMRGSQREERIKRALKLNLAMDNKDYETIKSKIKINQ